MHRNIFIYLVLAIAIAACREGAAPERSIRVKRIAESVESKKFNESDVLETTQVATVTRATGELVKGAVVPNTETAWKGRQTVKAERNVEKHFEERTDSGPSRPKVENIENFGKVNAKERRQRRHVSLLAESKAKEDDDHGDDMVQLKEEKENLRTDIVDEKVPEGGLNVSTQKTTGDSKIYEPTRGDGHGANNNEGERRQRIQHASMSTKTGLVAVVERTQNDDAEVEHTPDFRGGATEKRDGARILSKESIPKSLATTSTGNENNPSTNLAIHSPIHEDKVGVVLKLIDDVKDERNGRIERPDVDVYLYSNVPDFYKAPLPIVFDMLNAKEHKSPPATVTLDTFEHYFPAPAVAPPTPYSYKTLHQPRSNAMLQNAIDVVNMIVKADLDEMESSNADYDVYGPSSLIFGNGIGGVTMMDKGGNHKFERGFTGELANFCPFHGVEMIALGIDGFKDAPRNGGGDCSCSFKRNGQDMRRMAFGLNDLARTKRGDENQGRNVGASKPKI